MSPHPPPPILNLDNFTIDTEVPENCPFVLTSPRSLEACRRTGVQPVSLLPTTLAEYEEALPDLSREKVLQIFREVETAKEVKLGLCREIRRQLIWEETGEEGGQGAGAAGVNSLRLRGPKKLSCLSPIVEHVGGRDSALGTSNSGTTSQQTDSPEFEITPEPESLRVSKQNLRNSLSPQYFDETLISDKPESDQHFNFPIIRVESPEDACDPNVHDDVGDLASNLSAISHQTSLESDAFYSDLVFSETPSPISFNHKEKYRSEDWRSCPELDWVTTTQTGHQNTSFQQSEIMEQSISRSAHTIRVSDREQPLESALSPTYRRTPTPQCRKKKKASRSDRLTSESLQNLYDSTLEISPTDNKYPLQEDDCPESERTFSNQEKFENRPLRGAISGSCVECPTRSTFSQSPWHHNKPRTWVSPAHSNLVKNALSRSDIDIDQLQISQQDLRILEILTIRNNAEHERKQNQHKLRIQWEEERCKREAAKSELEKVYRKQLSEKRRKENDYCRRRLEQARDRFIRSQARLRQLLKEKDDRNKVLLETIAKQKEALLQQHREQEESRRLAVDMAVKDLLARDTQYRNELKNQMEDKLKNAEKRRKQNEMNKSLSLSETRRLEAEEHQQRMKKLEELYEDHIEKIKKTIEKKIKQSQEILRQQKDQQLSMSSRNSENISKTLALKAELESKLDLWRKQVLSVQSLSIRRAEEKVRNELDSRREKLAEEIRSREMKCLENKKEMEMEKKKKLRMTQKKIEEKDRKVEKLLNEREQSIIRARKMAETSAKLREIIKSFQ